MAIGIGEIVEGKVTGITKFAAFVSLGEGKTGMVHISEIAHSYVSEIREHLQEGQDVTVKIIGIDPEGRINLSIKKTLAPVGADRSPRPMSRPMPPRRPPVKENLTFEDKLKQFMHDSESKMSDLKQSTEHRTSRRKGQK